MTEGFVRPERQEGRVYDADGNLVWSETAELTLRVWRGGLSGRLFAGWCREVAPDVWECVGDKLDVEAAVNAMKATGPDLAEEGYNEDGSRGY
jgi:hypothetical protein